LDDVRLLLGPKDGFSFPSGHATTSFCLATVIAMRYPKLRYPIFILAIIVALSRPYVGVHYPSDILIGAVLGIFIGYIVTETAVKYERK
jgi:undecaprenyl-diphosphatase